MASCSSCFYSMKGSASPTDDHWCGYMGGDPQPGDPQRCRHVPLTQYRVPEGLVIAKSLRVVPVSDLAAENEAHSDAAGGGSWTGY